MKSITRLSFVYYELRVANILSASTCVSIIFLFAKIEKQFQITKIISLYKYIKQKKYGIFYKSMINLSFLLYTNMSNYDTRLKK